MNPAATALLTKYPHLTVGSTEYLVRGLCEADSIYGGYRAVTPDRCLKILKYLRAPAQLEQVIAACPPEAQIVLRETLTEPVVARHFAQRRS